MCQHNQGQGDQRSALQVIILTNALTSIAKPPGCSGLVSVPYTESPSTQLQLGFI